MTANQSTGLIETAKNIGVVLTAASAVLYASGYLALRARANALGTDPGFTLVDQAYIFAGFRFALVTLVALLVVAPFLILIKAVVRWLTAGLKPERSRAFAWGAAIVLAFLTLLSFFKTLQFKALLIGYPALGSGQLEQAILGYGDLRTWIALVATFTAALVVLWARSRLVELGPTDSLTVFLTMIAVLQLVLLPIQHGVFYADRSARRLARLPEGLVGVSPPVWLIDRGPDRASLVARSTEGGLCLITVKVESLDGIPVTRTMPIGEIVRSVLSRGAS